MQVRVMSECVVHHDSLYVKRISVGKEFNVLLEVLVVRNRFEREHRVLLVITEHNWGPPRASHFVSVTVFYFIISKPVAEKEGSVGYTKPKKLHPHHVFGVRF